MKIKFLIIAILAYTIVSGQQITGRVLDESGIGVSGASVILKKSSDSTVEKISVTDEVGKYKFPGISLGSYFIFISHVGYADLRTGNFTVKDSGDVLIPNNIVRNVSANLKGVTVTSRKPVISLKSDRIILNVEGTANENGQTAMELLRKSPGITVDQSGLINLNGKNGVQVYIDNKPSPLSGKDLSDYLSSIQSTGINSIEIISNPSAKYDASGNAGIVNIRLKKNNLFGTNGNISGGYGIGQYSKYNGGASLNYRNSRLNVYSNYNYTNAIYGARSSQERTLTDTIFNQSVRNKSLNRAHNFKAGSDFIINRTQTICLMANGSFFDNTLRSDIQNIISQYPINKTEKILVAANDNEAKRHNINTNLNYHFADSSGKDLNVDMDYGLYRINTDQYQSNLYFDSSGNNELFNKVYSIASPTDIDIYSVKTDYEQPFKKGRLGFGAKTSYVTSGNRYRQYDVKSGTRLGDSLHFNDFDYHENINSFYINYNKAFGGFKLQAGIRMENTNISGVSKGYKNERSVYVRYDSSFKLHYTNFFPSAAFTFGKNPGKQWSLTYSSRIDRPAYRDLNPFEFKIDDYTFRKGNINLKPQYTNSVGLSFLYHQSLTATLNFSHIKNVFGVIMDTADRSKESITKQNLSSQDIVSVVLSHSHTYKWYGLFVNMTSYYTKYKSDFGQGRSIDLDAFVFDMNATQSISFGKGMIGRVTAFYTTPAIAQGTLKIDNRWSVDADLQKSVLKRNGTLVLALTDIFNSSRTKGFSDFAGQRISSYNKEEIRVLRLSFTYRFGNNKVRAARQRRTGVEEESRRTF